MEFNQLQAFIKVAELGSFSKAAQALYLTQPAVSKRIALLEKTLDTILFERYGQKVVLSERGQALLPEARNIVEKTTAFLNHSKEHDQTIRGKLRIATSHHIGLYRLPKILQAFVSQYPDAQLDMHFTDSELAYEAVTQGNADLAIATLPVNQDATVDFTPLWTDELMITCSHTHGLASQPHIILDDLRYYPAILPDQGTFTRRIIDRSLLSDTFQFQVAFTTNYLETIKVMVKTGLGWSVLPAIMLDDDLFAQSLPNKQPTRALGVMVHKNKLITPTLAAFLNCLKHAATTSIVSSQIAL